MVLFLTSFILSGCNRTIIEVIANDDLIIIKDTEVLSYDYKELFTIFEDGEVVEVEDTYINTSNIRSEEGIYTISCNYKGKSALVSIEVVEVAFSLNLATDFVTVEVNEAMTYDYRSEFTFLIDGEEASIDSKMVSTDVEAKVGTYTYTVNAANITKTLIINVVEEHLYQVIAKKAEITITENQVHDYDYKELFTILKNNISVEVLDEYLTSAVKAEVGSYIIECNFQGKRAEVNVKVVDSVYLLTLSKEEINVKLSDALSYDYQALFSASIDGVLIPITNDLIKTNLKAEIGRYYYTITLENESKSLIVNIIDDSGYIVRALENEIWIKTYQVNTYDFKELFLIEKEDEEFMVLDDYLDKSSLKSEVGSYLVKCIYNDITASIIVHVVLPEETLDLDIEEVVVKLRDALNYDYKSLFTASIDGDIISITDDMVETDLKAEIGVYLYQVSLDTINKTLIVYIVENHQIEAIINYHHIEIEISNLEDFDYTKLFSLYVDGAFVEVTQEMLDLSSLESAEVDQDYNITLRHSVEDTSYELTLQIRVVRDDEILVSSQNIVTYPNGEYIDLVSLFKITKGKEEIPVTQEMITGTIDYSKAGDNLIRLNYDGIICDANVEVRLGVIIDYAKAETVNIIKGTNQLTYSFTNDFNVLINGVRFINLPESYILPHEVDFNTIGSYELTIEIPYNDKSIGLGGVKFDYFRKTITYEVIESEGNILVLEELVNLAKNANSYNVYNNLRVTINGRNQLLTEVKEYVDVITTYAQTLSDAIDFNKIGNQEVIIAVYINGVDAEPEIVSYYVKTYSEIQITKNIPMVFVGDLIYTKDLFTIRNGQEEIEVTSEMLTGKLDTFKAGVYTITLNYLDLVEEARVIVFDEGLKGVYRTNLPLIPVPEEDDDYSEVYGVSVYSMMTSTSKPRLLINEDGSIYYGNTKMQIIEALDERTMIVAIGSNEYTFTFDNGIIFLEPINRLKLRFIEERRPLLYFNTESWELVDHFIVSERSEYVLGSTYLAYSINTFQVKSRIDNTVSWYALMINYINKIGADHYYQVSWGEALYDSNFTMEVGTESKLIYLGKEYEFLVLTDEFGQIKTKTSERRYANMIFKGVFDGKAAELRADQSEGFTFVVDMKTVFKIPAGNVADLKNGGVTYSTNTIFLYSETELYSYKFIVDPDNLTFTLVERDQYYGKYQSDQASIFLDGYGSGIINFDLSSFRSSTLTYTLQDRVIELRYNDYLIKSTHGEYSTLYIDPFLNVVTFKYCEDKRYEGLSLENIAIVDGAIIKIKSYQIGKDSDAIARAKLYDNIDIITKDGLLDNTLKASIIDTSKVRFNTPGFYQITIKVKVGGVDVNSYYGVQILDDNYTNHQLTSTYGNGVIYKTNSLSINKYGQVIFENNGIIYQGIIVNAVDDTLYISARSKTNQTLSLVVRSIASDVVLVNCTGAVNFSDYYTTGLVRVAGNDKFVLREFSSASETIYILSNSISTLGEIVSLESINGISPSVIGSIIKFTANDQKQYAKILSWSSANSGLQLADLYRGTYTSLDAPNLVIDGFGSAIYGSLNGTYVLNNNIATITFIDSVKLYRLDPSTYNYEALDIPLDESLVRGLTFTASHLYFCENYPYTALTSFSFGENGIVTIKSTSPSHDEGEEQCASDTYLPSYASKDGVEGVYLVSGNKIKIIVNDVIFEFLINNLMNVNQITCISTTLNNTNHGYFSINTSFYK